jgi:MT-A70
MRTMKREHSRKPDEMYDLVESCSAGPFLELFARGTRPGWTAWGNQAEEYEPTWPTYSNHSGNEKAIQKKEQLRLIEQERAAFKL